MNTDEEIITSFRETRKVFEISLRRETKGDFGSIEHIEVIISNKLTCGQQQNYSSSFCEIKLPQNCSKTIDSHIEYFEGLTKALKELKIKLQQQEGENDARRSNEVWRTSQKLYSRR